MMEIKISDYRRPCWYEGRKAMFHMWYQNSYVVAPSLMVGGHNGGVVASILGLIEFEDGKTLCVEPEKIIFADYGGFDEYYFRENKK